MFSRGKLDFTSWIRQIAAFEAAFRIFSKFKVPQYRGNFTFTVIFQLQN
jgi:hypothetical protein